MPQAIERLLPDSAAIDTSAAEPAARLNFSDVPAGGAVYLLADSAGTPMLLATVRNLRAALERRLTDTPTEQKSKRLQYGQLCSTLRYRRVCSPFAANFHYLQTARTLFPKQYRAMVTWRPSWFVGVDQTSPHPQFRKTIALDDPALNYFGPIPDKHAAGRLVESLDDLFDLCRYHNILIQAPHGKPCAYKEMGKCPAPCDGSISLAEYHSQIEAAAGVLARGGHEAWRHSLEGQMKAVAAQLQFEAAANVKARLARAAFLDQFHFAYMDALEQFTFLSLQPGPGTSWVQPFFIHGGAIDEGAPAKRKDLATAVGGWHRKIQKLAATPVVTPLTPQQAEHVALVAFHLFRGADDAGIYLRPADLPSPADILAAGTALLGRRSAKPLPDQSSDRQQEAEPVEPETPAGGANA